MSLRRADRCFLSRDRERNQVEIPTLKEQLAATHELVRQLAEELQRVQEREPHERAKLPVTKRALETLLAA